MYPSPWNGAKEQLPYSLSPFKWEEARGYLSRLLEYLVQKQSFCSGSFYRSKWHLSLNLPPMLPCLIELYSPPLPLLNLHSYFRKKKSVSPLYVYYFCTLMIQFYHVCWIRQGLILRMWVVYTLLNIVDIWTLTRWHSHLVLNFLSTN